MKTGLKYHSQLWQPAVLLLNTIQQPTIRQSVLLLAIAQSMNVIVMARDKICLDIDARFHDIISII